MLTDNKPTLSTIQSVICSINNRATYLIEKRIPIDEKDVLRLIDFINKYAYFNVSNTLTRFYYKDHKMLLNTIKAVIHTSNIHFCLNDLLGLLSILSTSTTKCIQP